MGEMSTVSTTSLPDWVLPYAQQFLSQYGNLVFPGGQMAQYPQGLNQTVAPLQPWQNQGLGMIAGGSQQGQGVAQQGLSSLQDTLSGKYLDPSTNPYLKATYDAAAKGVTSQYRDAIAPSTMAAAQRAGQMGGSAYNQLKAADQYNLGQNLSGLAANIYGGNFQAERGRQAGAQAYLPSSIQAGALPGQQMLGAGSFLQQFDQQGRDVATQNALRQFQFPFQLLSGFGGALGQASGGTGSSTTTSSIGSGNGLPSWVLPALLGTAGVGGLSSLFGQGGIFGSGQSGVQ